MDGVAWPGMPGGFAGQSSLKSDLVPDLFAGIAGGYRIGLVAGGISSTQKLNSVDTSSEIVSGSSDPTQTSGWVGSSSYSSAPANQLASYSSVSAASAGPSIAVNAAATDLGVDMTGTDPFAVQNGPAPIPNPEPASLVLLGTGLLGAAVVARRRRARRSASAV